MKYYHLIYNSSQRTQEGMVGLGIRSYTEGMPKEYMDTLKENGFFAYSSGNKPQPAPKDLLENGSLILQLPVTYNYAKLFVSSTGKEIYVISRTVSVGFDYPYYVKFTAARMDNFVMDAYVFEEIPPIEMLQVYYEQPAADSVCFVPQNRIPNPENEEMKALSLDKMPLFVAEEKSFECKQLQCVCPQSIELLFAFLEAHRLNIPLLVKCKNEDAASMMVDMMRILPEDLSKNAFFYINYQLEGVKEGYKAFFIDDSYKFNYSDYGQFFVFDMMQSDTIKTQESESFRNEVTKLVEQDNKPELDKRISWMFNPVYDTIRDKSVDVKRIFYNYVVDQNNFNIVEVFNFKGDDLWKALKTYFGQDQKNQELFNKQIDYYLKNEQVVGDQLLSLLVVLNRMDEFGFSLNGIINGAKPQVSSKLLQSPEDFRRALDKIGLDKLIKYFDKQTFEKHSNYLDEKIFHADWAALYKCFYPQEKIADKTAIVSDMLTKQLPKTTVDTVFSDFGMNKIDVCTCLTNVAKKTPSLTESVFVNLWNLLNNSLIEHTELPEQALACDINQFVLKPMEKNDKFKSELGQCRTLMQLLMGNFTETNASILIVSALNIGTRQAVSILFEKGINYVGVQQVDNVVDAIIQNLKPEKEDFVSHVQNAQQKFLLLTSFFRKQNENKKTLNKMQKDGLLQLDDKQFAALLTDLGIENGKELDGKKKLYIQIIIIAIIALIIGGGIWLVLRQNNTSIDPSNKAPHADPAALVTQDKIDDSTLLPEPNSSYTSDAFNDIEHIGTSTVLTPQSAPEPFDKLDNKVEKIHVIQSGETLSVIARRYCVQVDSIKKWNNLTNDNIKEGSKLTIFTPNASK